MIALTFAAALLPDSAQSQTTSQRGQPKSEQSTKSPSADLRGTDQMPLTVKIQPSQDAEKQAERNEHKEAEKAEIDRKLAFETQRIADYTLWMVCFTFGVVFVTGLLGVATFRAASAAKAAAEHIQKVERAFVKLSGVAPGITPDVSGLFWINISTRNFGRTPATISDTLLNHLVLPHGAPLPENPPYERQMAQIPGAFLVANEEIFTQVVYRITAEEMGDVEGFLSDLYLIGYVDYRDQFGERHRAGYARVYRPAINDRATYRTDAEFEARSNLVFVAPREYNYDRPRNRSQGIDWDQTT